MTEVASPRYTAWRTSVFVVAILTTGSQACAQDDDALSVQLAITSDYVYREQSFSDGRPAAQASVTWRPDAIGLAGLHADGWLSTIDFGDGDPAYVEASATLGYEISIGALTIDTGLTYIS